MENDTSVLYFKCTACSECFMSEKSFTTHSQLRHCKILLCQGNDQSDFYQAADSHELPAALIKSEPIFAGENLSDCDVRNLENVSPDVLECHVNKENYESKSLVPHSQNEQNKNFTPENCPGTMCSNAEEHKGTSLSSTDPVVTTPSEENFQEKVDNTACSVGSITNNGKSINQSGRTLMAACYEGDSVVGLGSESCSASITDTTVASFAMSRIFSSNHQCPICGKIFAQRYALNRHIKIHSGERPHVCQYCGAAFVHSYHLSSHLKRHCRDKKFKCDVCTSLFSTAAALLVHKASVHGGGNQFKCPICLATFQNRNALLIHRRAHASTHGSKFTCSICFQHFTHPSLLRSHMKQHNMLQCDVCDATFRDKSELCNHRQSQHNIGGNPDEIESLYDPHHLSNTDTDTDKFYKCTLCTASFSIKSSLNRHFKIHTEEKRVFTCGTCGKDFTEKCHLVTHQRIHTGEKPYICYICAAPFYRPDMMVKHFSSKHSSDLPFYCETCGATFALLKALKFHKRSHDFVFPVTADG